MKKQSVYPYTIKEAPGATVHWLRTAQQWSQRQLADKCKPALDHTTIRRLEQNNGFTQDTLERVATALGVTVPDLFIPPELAEISRLPPEIRERVISNVQDAITAYKYKKQG